jgi:hypothetical protein
MVIKHFRVAKIIILLVGSALLLGAWFVYDSTREFLATAVTAQGVVTDLQLSRSSDSNTYNPVFEFQTPDGKIYEVLSSAGSNPPSYARGEQVEVFYQADDPYDAKINGFFTLWGAAAIVGGLGVIFFLVGAAIAIYPLLKSRSHARLRSEGQRIISKVVSVGQNESVRINGRHPHQVVTQWQNPATGDIHLFKSASLMFDPSDYMSRKDITVYIERNDPDTYWKDLDFLPELAE